VQFKRDFPWTYAELAVLWDLSKKRLSLQEISFRLGRNKESVRAKAEELEISLKETSNQ
jgi:hypothetical protein